MSPEYRSRAFGQHLKLRNQVRAELASGAASLLRRSFFRQPSFVLLTTGGLIGAGRLSLNFWLTSFRTDYLRVHVYGQTIFVLAGNASPSSSMTEIGTCFSASGSAFIEPESRGSFFRKSAMGSIQ